MKNNFFRIIYIFAATFAFVSCSDEFLQEKKLFNSFNYDIFKSETQINRYLAYMYKYSYNGYDLPTKSLWGSWTEDFTKMTEEIGGTVGKLINESETYNMPEDIGNYYGKRLTDNPTDMAYTLIRDCNTIVENMEKYGMGYLSPEFIRAIKGQALFIRAMQYFDFMRIYGGVPLVTKVQSAVSLDESIKIPRASVSEMIRQITADFDSAAACLPNNWKNSAADFGRPTRGAALAMKCRVLLTGASPLFNRDWDNSSHQRWTDALAAGIKAEEELVSAGYNLYGSSAKDWTEMFYKFNNMKCPEAIYTVLHDSATNGLKNGWEGKIRLYSQEGGSGIPAPKEMIDLFPMANGSRPDTANGYNEFLFFMDRDPRFYRTFAFSGRNWKYNTTTSDTIWAYNWVEVRTTGTREDTIYHYSDANTMVSPAFVCKMSNLNITGAGYFSTEIFEYRFAELLLNIAECYAATGQVDKCSEYLGKVRARVGIPAANNYGIGTLADKYAALEACLYERRIELAYEGKRFWDIQRWMLYNDDEPAGNNTCAKLRIPPINGTCRTGKYLMAVDTVKTISPAIAVDPYLTDRSNLVFDPDAVNSSDQLNDLANFYTSHFKIADLDQPLDKIGSNAAFIGWKQNYYISGLNREALTYNPWLQQTQGWFDIYGNQGTFTYR